MTKKALPGDFAMPVYHIETPNPSIRPPYLIWQCYGNFTGKLQYFSECCKFPENDHIWSEGAIVHGGGGPDLHFLQPKYFFPVMVIHHCASQKVERRRSYGTNLVESCELE